MVREVNFLAMFAKQISLHQHTSNEKGPSITPPLSLNWHFYFPRLLFKLWYMLWLLMYWLWAPLSAALYVAFLFGSSGIIFNKSAPGEHDQMMSILSLL
jgi:hypothetical protein